MAAQLPALKIKQLQARASSYGAVYEDIVITARRNKLG